MCVMIVSIARFSGVKEDLLYMFTPLVGPSRFALRFEDNANSLVEMPMSLRSIQVTDGYSILHLTKLFDFGTIGR